MLTTAKHPDPSPTGRTLDGMHLYELALPLEHEIALRRYLNPGFPVPAVSGEVSAARVEDTLASLPRHHQRTLEAVYGLPRRNAKPDPCPALDSPSLPSRFLALVAERRGIRKRDLRVWNSSPDEHTESIRDLWQKARHALEDAHFAYRRALTPSRKVKRQRRT